MHYAAEERLHDREWDRISGMLQGIGEIRDCQEGKNLCPRNFGGGHSAIGGNSYYNLGRNTLNPKAAYESDEYIRNGIYSQGVKIP